LGNKIFTDNYGFVNMESKIDIEDSMADFEILNEHVETGMIEILGARVHNLKNIDVSFPRNKLIVITGLSGSGKSSLAFDTIYAEGQRRYMESFSAYARQFLGNMERPDVDKITGLSPVISIEQKTTNQNPRSTVGTVTEIYDFMRLLFARAGIAFSYETGKPMVRLSDDQILSLIISEFEKQKILILAPIIKGRKGHYRELFEQYMHMGFLRMRIDGKITELTRGMQIDRYKTHDIELIVDTITADESARQRINNSLQLAMKYGKGTIMVNIEGDLSIKHYSRHLMCADTGISYDEPAPNNFSFNSPYGSCKKCNGLGTIPEVDINTIIPNPKLSIKKGGIVPLGEQWDSWVFRQIDQLGEKYDFTLDTPVGKIPEDVMNVILFGSDDVLKGSVSSIRNNIAPTWTGIINIILSHLNEHSTESYKKWARKFMQQVTCPLCKGTRLKNESLFFKIDKKNIAELSNLSLSELFDFFENIEDRLSGKQKIIATEVVKEIRKRIKFMLDVGLDYLSLDRSSKSLSGGEAQRIRLASQIGSQLVGVLYILDEPSIGLHQRDNKKLIQSLKELRDIGNSIIVVEHDKETIKASDYIIDLGPGAGVHGGRIVAAGDVNSILKSNSLTCKYLNGDLNIAIPEKKRTGNGKEIIIEGATGNNLKDINLIVPLGKLIVITGVSGSGKSTLISETLYPILNQYFYNSLQKPLPYKKIKGIENVDKVIEVDQSPIGRTPRSNPATYTGVFTEIRNLFASLPESKIRGYNPGRFSFNVKGGRCETCKGAGMRVIEMNFLPDVSVKCETCNGRRYNRETLEVRYRGKSISDILDMSIEDAVVFFENIPSILHKINTLQEVGLGYITIGQQSTTLSGGEAQRIKLAAELSKKDTGNTFYILDEPTTGLHFDDVRVLLEVLQKLTDKGNTIMVIEHNMDVIKVADHVIDLGPEGGVKGGNIVAEGSPEEIIKNRKSITAQFLREEFSKFSYNQI
jgi:excinuclease ABC subunit A